MNAQLQAMHAGLFRVLVRKARTNFLTYLLLFHMPGAGEFILGSMHAFLAVLAQAVFEGKRGKRQAISVPPQHGKSTILSKEFVSWAVGVRPGLQVAITGFSHALSSDFSKEVRKRTQTPLYKLIFPDAGDFQDGYDKQDSWMLDNGSTVLAKSVGKQLTGRRADLLIIDDPHSGRREAESATMRQRAKEWYTGDCLTRLTPGGIILVIGTRWHPEDLIGHLTSEAYEEESRAKGLTQELYETVNLPAIAEENDPLGRAPGEALFPEVRDARFLMSLKAALPAYEWESQYSGRPTTRGSGQVDVKLISKIAITDIPEGLEWVRGWDLALTVKSTSDFTAGALCAYDKVNDHLYIAGMFHRRMVWAVAKGEIKKRSLHDKAEFGVSRIGMEGVSGFSIGADEVRAVLLGEVKVEKRNPPKGCDKLVRAQPWLNKVEAGKVSIVRGDWCNDFLRELEVFPDGTHDDRVDAISVCWEMLTMRGAVLFA